MRIHICDFGSEVSAHPIAQKSITLQYRIDWRGQEVSWKRPLIFVRKTTIVFAQLFIINIRDFRANPMATHHTLIPNYQLALWIHNTWLYQMSAISLPPSIAPFTCIRNTLVVSFHRLLTANSWFVLCQNERAPLDFSLLSNYHNILCSPPPASLSAPLAASCIACKLQLLHFFVLPLILQVSSSNKSKQRNLFIVQ